MWKGRRTRRARERNRAGNIKTWFIRGNHEELLKWALLFALIFFAWQTDLF